MRSRRYHYPAIISALVLSSLVGSVHAQYGMSNPRSVAMGGAYTVLARGVEAPNWNPANLAFQSKRNIHINLVSLGVGFDNNSFTKSQYDLYNGSFLTEADKQDILASIPADGLRGDLGTEVQALGVSVGSFAFTATGLGASNFVLSKDIADLILNGNEIDRVYEIKDSDGDGWAASSFALSTAFLLDVPRFERFSVGGSIKYLRGFAFAEVKEAESQFSTSIDGLQGDGRLVVDHARGGNGLAFDLGATAQLNEEMTVGLSLTNILNYLNWTDDPERFTYTFTSDSLSIQKIEDTDIDSVFIDSDENVAIEPFTTSLPPQLRIGFMRTMRRLTIAADLKQGLKKAAGVSTTPELAVGAEFLPVQFFPLRAGFSLGGNQGFSMSGGFAFDFSVVSLDFAIASRRGMFSGKGLAFAFGWMFRL